MMARCVQQPVQLVQCVQLLLLIMHTCTSNEKNYWKSVRSTDFTSQRFTYGGLHGDTHIIGHARLGRKRSLFKIPQHARDMVEVPAEIILSWSRNGHWSSQKTQAAHLMYNFSQVFVQGPARRARSVKNSSDLSHNFRNSTTDNSFYSDTSSIKSIQQNSISSDSQTNKSAQENSWSSHRTTLKSAQENSWSSHRTTNKATPSACDDKIEPDESDQMSEKMSSYQQNKRGFYCYGTTDITPYDSTHYRSQWSLPLYKGPQERQHILIQNRTQCNQPVHVDVTCPKQLTVTVATCCITWCAQEIVIELKHADYLLLNFQHFNVPGLNLGRSGGVTVECDESLKIYSGAYNKDLPAYSRSYCGIQEPKSVFLENRKATLVLNLKDNSQCVENVNFTVQVMPCLKSPYTSCNSSAYVQFNRDHGYISSPGLDMGLGYPHNLNCSWEIIVPPGQLIRLETSEIQLRKGDIINVYPAFTELKQFPKVLRLSGGNFRQPVILPSNKCILEFLSDGSRSDIGFNISYEAVDVSQFVPMYDNHTLDCSIFNKIPTSFICNYHIDCAKGEDENNCIYKDKRCWPQGYAILGRCHHVILNQPRMSWTMAEEFCERNLSSHLLTVNTDDKVRPLKQLREFFKPHLEIMFLGLRRMRIQQVKQLYRRMWQWTDGTTAFYLPDEYRYEGWSTCSMLHGEYFHTTDCGAIKENVSFICERKMDDYMEASSATFRESRSRNKNISAISESKISVFKCATGEYISVDQRCDKLENCFDRSDEQGCQYDIIADKMFSCDSDGLLAYTFVCDGIAGCQDSSDEKHCAPLDKNVLGPTMTTCTDGVILERSRLCDGKEDCRDASDEEDCTECVGGAALCPMIACLPQNWQTDGEIDCPIRDLKGKRVLEQTFTDNIKVTNSRPTGIVKPDGYGKFIIEFTETNECPPTHLPCTNGYCIPVYMWCNGMLDCPHGEDENLDLCPEACVGMYKCKYTQVCVHNENLCDGYYQCPNHDDETLCSVQNVSCPQGCSCTRMEFTCSSLPRFQSHTPVRYLRLEKTHLRELNIEGITSYSLIYLNVSSCHVRSININNFRFLNLGILDLSHNQIAALSKETFKNCPSLRTLMLSHNALHNASFAFLENTKELSKLDMSYNMKHKLEDDCFHKAVNLEELFLKYMHIEEISAHAFRGLVRLRRLDLKGNNVARFSMDIFHFQKNLRAIVTDNFRLCCPSIKPSSVQFTDCLAPYDEISSCADILRTLLLRVALWLMAMLTITGNFGVIIYRIFYDKGIKYSFRIIITCLSASDLIMGIYLVIIGTADVMYRDRYLLTEREWKSSVPCQVAGFLCVLSSETSALFILLVTIDRLLAIAFPLHPALHFNTKSASVACLLVWAVGVAMATVPLLPPFQHWELYSQKAVGVPLPITRIHFPGYDYAFAIFILFNMVVFLLVGMGQLLIYLSVRLQKHPQISEARVRQDTAIAKRLVLVVITDCLCWFPITVMGLAARSGQPVPGEMYLVTTVFLLPANSAFNPFLYTANAILLARRNRRKKKAAEMSYGLRQIS